MNENLIGISSVFFVFFYVSTREISKMEFKINSKVLEKLLAKVIPAVPSRTPMPILENFLLEVKDGLLTVSSTDLEIALRSSINVATDENVKIVIPARLLYDIIRSLGDNQVHFKTDQKSRISLLTESGTYNISYSSPEDFPEVPEVSKEKEISLGGNDLKRFIDQTSFAMSKEDMRPAMTGTLFDFSENGLRFVTTDGHRLVKYVNRNVKFNKEEQYVVPERAISVLSKLLGETDVKIYLSKTHVSFNFGDLELISRLIGEKYPAYNSVIPLENDKVLKVKTEDLLATIKRMMIFSTASSKQVKFSIKENILEVSAEDVDHGSNAKENVNCEYSGEQLDIGFNTVYVSDILSHVNDDESVFKFHSPTKACIIEPGEVAENEELMLLLMPVRLNN
jgi:DNA polymerase-3 subunit beta